MISTHLLAGMQPQVHSPKKTWCFYKATHHFGLFWAPSDVIPRCFSEHPPAIVRWLSHLDLRLVRGWSIATFPCGHPPSLAGNIFPSDTVAHEIQRWLRMVRTTYRSLCLMRTQFRYSTRLSSLSSFSWDYSWKLYILIQIGEMIDTSST